MIIPIRCVTCNKVIADKWREYQRLCAEADQDGTSSEVVHLNAKELPPNFGDKFRGKILDQLGLDKICCRRHMLGHVDMIDII